MHLKIQPEDRVCFGSNSPYGAAIGTPANRSDQGVGIGMANSKRSADTRLAGDWRQGTVRGRRVATQVCTADGELEASIYVVVA